MGTATTRLSLGLLLIWAPACGGQTAMSNEAAAPPAPLFDYAPESFVSVGPNGYEERQTYSYEGGRLVRMTKTNAMPEAPRSVLTLSYGAHERLETVVTETFWGADPFSTETEVRRYDAEGRLAGIEVTGELVGRNEPTEGHTVTIDRDGSGRRARVVEQGPHATTEFTVSYDATGHIAAVAGPVSRLDMTFDETGRLTRESTTRLSGLDTSTSWSVYAYDSQGFISHACEFQDSADGCSPSNATLVFALTRDADGTPLELVKTSAGSSLSNTTTIRYTSASTSMGFQQLRDGHAVPSGFVMAFYGRGEIDEGKAH